MDETDSRYAMVPPLTFTTTYYVNRPAHTGSSKPYSISFSTDPYNPLGAYFTLQAQKLVTQVAIMTHLQSISKGLQQLGDFYLQLDTWDKLAACQRQLVQVSRENLTYAENRLSIGTGTSLEVQVARQQLDTGPGRTREYRLVHEAALSYPEKFSGIGILSEFHP